MNEKRSSDAFWKVLSVLLFVALISTVAVILWQSKQPVVRYEPTAGAKSHLASFDPAFEPWRIQCVLDRRSGGKVLALRGEYQH